MRYKISTEDQNKYRERLKDYILQSGTPIYKIALEIKINADDINKFLMGELEFNYQQISKIYKFLKDKNGQQ